MIVIFISYTG